MRQVDTRLVWQHRLRPLLHPLGALWGWVQSLRRDAYRRGRTTSISVSIPVLSIGSLQAGGTGKTPFAAHVANRIQTKRVAVLSRGYGGDYAQPCRVTSDATARRVGDEPVLLSRLTQADVWVARDRAALAARLASSYDVLLLDDGYQHLRLRRTLNIGLLSSDPPGAVLPAGLWRERPSALVDADFVIGIDHLPPWLSEYYGGDTGVVRFVPGPWCAFGQPPEPPRRVLAFCGIARPERFASSLSDLEVVDLYAYPDHHVYSPSELAHLVREAKRHAACVLVTTAKDAVRLGGWSFDLPLLWRDVQTQWCTGEAKFAAALTRALAEK